MQHGDTALHKAAMQICLGGRADGLEALITAGVDVTAQNQVREQTVS